jgi:hypothetical protein
VTDEPTPRDILNVAAVIDDLAASAAIEDALRTEPLTRQEQINEVLVRQVHEHGDPDQIRQADFLMDLYKVGAFRGDA